MKLLLSTKEAASELGVSLSRFKRFVRLGIIKPVKTLPGDPLYRRADLLKLAGEKV